jgi:autotransporter-associated beta strand protein
MASGTWTSVLTSGAWNTASNWSGGLPANVANGADFTANFTSNITAPTTIDTTTGANWSGTIGNITFSDAGASGSAWTLGSQATITLAGGTPTITTTTNATFNGAIAGTAGLTKAGTATLTLGAVNSYTGTTTVSAGKMSLASNQYNTLGFPSGAITISSGATLSADNTSNNAHNIGALTLAGGTLTSINGPGGVANDGTFGNWVLNGGVFCTVSSTISSTTLSVQAGNFDVNSGVTLTVSAAVINQGVTPTAVMKTNTGILKLTSGSSTYSNGTSITAGTLQVGNNAALGTGTVTMTGGKLSSSSTTGYTLANALTLNGTMTLGDATHNGALTFSGTTTISGTTALTPAGSDLQFSGTLVTNANFTKGGGPSLFLTGGIGSGTGNMYVAQAGLFLAGYNSGTPHQLNNATTIDVSGDGDGYLNPCGNTAYTFNNTFTGTGDINVRNTSAAGITFNGTMSGYTGQIRIYATTLEGANPVQKVTFTSAGQFAGTYNYLSASGLTSLSQTFAYSGSTVVNHNQPFFINPGSTVGVTAVYRNESSNNSALNGANVVWLQSSNPATFRLDAASGDISFANQIHETSTGVLSLSKIGNYAATLSGTSNYRGTVSVSAGTFNANSTTALGADTSSGTVSSGATLSLGAALNYSARNWTINGTGVSVGGVLQGAIRVAVPSSGTAKIGAIALGSAAYIRGTATGTLSSSFTATSGALTLGSAASTVYTQSGAISSSLTLTVGGSSSDTGEVILSGVNSSLTGAITVNYGTLSFATQASVGAVGTLTLTRFGTVAQFNAATTTNRPITGRGEVALRATGAYSFGQITMPAGNGSAFGGNALALTAHETATLTSAIVFPSSISFVQEFYPKAKAGKTLTLQGVIDSLLNSNPNIYYWAETEGSVVISGSNTYSGYSILYEGTIQAAAPEAVGVSGPFGINTTSGAILMYSTGTLQYSASNNADYSGRFDTTGGERWKIDTNGQSVTFASSLQGASSLVQKLGAGTLTLTGTNTYTGSTTVTAGTLRAGNVQAFGTAGTTTIAAGATLQTLTAGGQNGKLTVAALNNSAGGTIKIGG